MRSQWTLHFTQSFVQIHGSGLTFSEKIPEGLCNLFQVNDLTFERNANKKESGHFWVIRVRARLCGTSLHSAADAWSSSLHFPNRFSNLSGISVEPTWAVSERGAHLKCCYLTWQEQDCRQSPETTLCQWSTNRLWDGFAVWGTGGPCVHTLWWPFFDSRLTNKAATVKKTRLIIWNNLKTEWSKNFSKFVSDVILCTVALWASLIKQLNTNISLLTSSASFGSNQALIFFSLCGNR